MDPLIDTRRHVSHTASGSKNNPTTVKIQLHMSPPTTLLWCAQQMTHPIPGLAHPASWAAWLAHMAHGRWQSTDIEIGYIARRPKLKLQHEDRYIPIHTTAAITAAAPSPPHGHKQSQSQSTLPPSPFPLPAAARAPPPARTAQPRPPEPTCSGLPLPLDLAYIQYVRT